jgi:hypothetical protein
MTEFLPGLTNYDVIAWDLGSSTSVLVLFGPPNSSQAGSSEPLNSFPLTKTFIVKRVKAFIRVNTRGLATPMALRDDSVSVLSWSIPAGATNLQFDSGPITLRIEAGSTLSLMIDLASAGAGTSSWVVFAEGSWM